MIKTAQLETVEKTEIEPAILQTSISEAEYWNKYYSDPVHNYEWNNGFLEIKPMSERIKFVMYLWFQQILKDYLYVFPVADLTGLELGFKLNLPTKTIVRKPDLGVVLRKNSIPLGDHDRTYKGIFDLCIESLSTSNRQVIERDTVHKKLEYAQVGVPEYYILDDRGIETAFYEIGPQGVYVPMADKDGIIRSNILPGFQFRIDDLYLQPEPPTMVTDPIYDSFISPHYRQERLRSERLATQLKEAHQKLRSLWAWMQQQGVELPEDDIFSDDLSDNQ